MEHNTSSFDPVQKTRSFLKTITKKSKIAVLYDDDPDGTCSAVIMTKLVEKYTGTKVAHKKTAPHEPLKEELIQKLTKKGATHIIICDLSVEGDQGLKKAEQKFRILSLDHHQLLCDANSDRTTLIKPQMFWKKGNPLQYCTSKLAYDIASQITEMKNAEWLAVTGSIADIATEPWKDWLNNYLKENGDKPKKDLFQTMHGKAAITINDAYSYDDNLQDEIFNEVYKAKSAKELVESKLRKYHQTIQQEIEKWKQKFKTQSEYIPEAKLKYLQMKTPYRIKSTLNTIISLTVDKENTVIIYEHEKEDATSFSARNQTKKVPLNDILRKAVEGLKESVAGGHIPAAGGHCRTQDWPKVKKKITDAHKKIHAQKTI